mmetsp:Transcript_145591/g.405741  ORF Transcript_145591/g.405741 Transcript_145591/m.405741 type:complete len:277 (+) Transcript_145591:84-914(+)
MPVDPSRILGFGSDGSVAKVWRCPGGHLLQPWTAMAGTCDRCCRPVEAGEHVMDCRQCNWYLCEDCHPQEHEQGDGTLWGSVSSFLGAATREVKGVATGVETFMSGLSEQLQDMTEQLQDMKDKISCQPVSNSQLAAEEIEVRPLSLQEERSDEEGHGGAFEESGRHHRKAVSQAVRRPSTRACEQIANDSEVAGSATQKPSQPEKPQEPKDLIDIGQSDLLDLNSPAPPRPPVLPQDPLDLLDLPGLVPGSCEAPCGAKGRTSQPLSARMARLGA